MQVKNRLLKLVPVLKCLFYETGQSKTQGEKHAQNR